MTQQLDLKPGKKSIFSRKSIAQANRKAVDSSLPEVPVESEIAESKIAESKIAESKVTVSKRLPIWASLLIAANGISLLGVSIATTRPDLVNRVLDNPRIAPIVAPILANVWPNRVAAVPSAEPSVESSPETARTVLSYEQWLDVLKQEAIAVSTKNPERLTVLLGDSLSLWFPPEQLPGDRSWLNQGISGDTTASLIKRLAFLDVTKPQTILIMAGINDLKSGVSETELLANYRTIVQTLKQKHPETEIVIQSILPHGGPGMTTEERDRLLSIPNEQIFRINQQLATIAKEEQVKFLNLQPLFSDQEGMLRSNLTTDGLHLNPNGYLVWSTALQTFSQTQLKPAPEEKIGPEEVQADGAPIEANSLQPEEKKTTP